MPSETYSVPDEDWVVILPAASTNRSVELVLQASGALWVAAASGRPDGGQGTPLTPSMGTIPDFQLDAGLTLYARGISRNSRLWAKPTDLAGGTGDGTGTGWADYSDRTYTQEKPLRLDRNKPIALPNDGKGGNRGNEPAGTTLYKDGRIRAGNGDFTFLSVRFKWESFKLKKSIFPFDIWLDAGGVLSSLYPDSKLIKGTMKENPYLHTFGFYALGGFEERGAQVMVQPGWIMDVWDIEYVIHRSHKGFVLAT